MAMLETAGVIRTASKKFANASGTGAHTGNQAALLVTGAAAMKSMQSHSMGPLMAEMGTLLGINAFAKLLTNKNFVNFLANDIKVAEASPMVLAGILDRKGINLKDDELRAAAQTLYEKASQTEQTKGQAPQTAAPAATPAPAPQPQQQNTAAILDEARRAIQSGKDPAAIAARLQKMGIDPSALGQ
jgi:hypothetical protein